MLEIIFLIFLHFINIPSATSWPSYTLSPTFIFLTSGEAFLEDALSEREVGGEGRQRRAALLLLLGGETRVHDRKVATAKPVRALCAAPPAASMLPVPRVQAAPSELPPPAASTKSAVPLWPGRVCEQTVWAAAEL